MKHAAVIVPVSVCVVSAMLALGCDRGEAQANPSLQQAPAAPAKPAPAPPKVTPPAKPEPAKPAAGPAAPAAPAAPVAPPAKPEPVKPAPTTPPAAEVLTHEVPVNKAAAPNQVPQSTVQIVKAEPAEIDLGDIPTNDTKSGKVRLINTGDAPMTVVSARPSCGCTAMKFTPNTIIPAKEAIEVELQMNGGPKEGPVHGKTVTFIVEGQPEVIVPIKGQAVSFVKTTPAALDPATMPDGKVTLKSVDGNPFKIMSVQPQVAEFDADSKPEHEIKVSWEKYREIGINRQMIVYLDHPKCQSLFVQVNFTPEELQTANAKMQADAVSKNRVDKGPGLQQPIVPTPQMDPDTELATMIHEGRNSEVLAKLQTGLSVDYRDANGTTLLGIAAREGNADLLKALLAMKKIDINGTDNNGRTPLMYAAGSKNVETVRVLLDQGANPTTRDTLGATALWWAAMRGDGAAVTELVDAGADVEIVGTVTGWTPLMVAAGFGDPNSIEPLLKAHANIEALDMLEGATPLIHAARTGRIEAIKALIKHGAKLENADRNGNTPFLACAAYSGGEADKLKVLIDAGANIRAKDNRGFNALVLARKRTDIRAAEVIKMLEPMLGSETPAEGAAASPASAEAGTPKASGQPGHEGHNHD